MRLPNGIYESLPYLLCFSGTIAISHFHRIIGYGSGLLLILTAGVLFLMRSDYRKISAKRGS
jgi:hypothetical protein